MLKVGITGGIGSGKSTVCSIFNVFGIPVFNADIEAKKLYDENEELKKIIVSLFGVEFYQDGIFNRKKMADLVFTHPDRLKQLNEIIHPLVQYEFEKWATSQKAPYIIKEAALLIESDAYLNLNKLILVSSPFETRIRRVIKRDQVSREVVLLRINQQLSDEEKRKYCQFEIINDDQKLLIPQVLAIHEILLKEINISTVL